MPKDLSLRNPLFLGRVHSRVSRLGYANLEDELNTCFIGESSEKPELKSGHNDEAPASALLGQASASGSRSWKLPSGCLHAFLCGPENIRDDSNEPNGNGDSSTADRVRLGIDPRLDEDDSTLRNTADDQNRQKLTEVSPPAKDISSDGVLQVIEVERTRSSDTAPSSAASACGSEDDINDVVADEESVDSLEPLTSPHSCLFMNDNGEMVAMGEF